MKIVCDNCATKYSIADEKVRGKVFKIRCKKCSHIIVVRGGGEGGDAPVREAAPAADAGFPGDDGATASARGGAAPAVAASGDAVWHLVIDREQVGPLTPPEVRQKFSAGEIDVETYAWREGFGDWLRLGSIDDFRDLGGGGASEGSTKRTDSADLFAAGADDGTTTDAPAGDLFGGGVPSAPTPAYSSAPAPAAASAAGEDVFGGGGGGLFGAPSAAPARSSRQSSPGFAASAASEPSPSAGGGGGGGGGVDVRPMTGQRNENSVLFSLNNLQALATGGNAGPSAKPMAGSAGSGEAPRPGYASSQTEGSGLIDIRAMAASTLAASPSGSGPAGKGEELPGLGSAPVFSPMAAPILMPAQPSGPPKWMFAILGVGVLAVLGIVVVGVLLLTKKPAEPAAVAAVAPAAAAPAAAAVPAGTAPAAAAPAAAVPAAAAAAPTDKGEKHVAAGGTKPAKGDKGTKLAKSDAPAAKTEAPAAAAPAPAAAAPKKSGKRDELDDLLNNASPGETPKGAAASHKAAAREEPSGGGGADLPESLGRSEVVAGMSKVKSRVTACYDQFKVPGTANVALTIANSGRVQSASVTGTFAGTPTGECVAKAVKSASFPPWKGAAMTINYPYMLR